MATGASFACIMSLRDLSRRGVSSAFTATGTAYQHIRLHSWGGNHTSATWQTSAASAQVDP